VHLLDYATDFPFFFNDSRSMRSFYALMVLVAVGLAVGVGLTMTRLKPAEMVRPVEAVSNAIRPGEDPRFPPLPPENGSLPSAVVEGSTTFNFGEMEIGSSDTHTWVFHNRGNYPLELRQGESTCKCTIAGVETNQIPPGKKADVTLRWTIKTQEPFFRQSAAILTNDPTRRRIELVAEGTTNDTLRIIPASFSSRKPRKAPKIFEASLFCVRTEQLEITGHRLSNHDLADFFEVEVTPLDNQDLRTMGARSAKKITIKVLPGLPDGPIDQKVIFMTNLPQRPEVMISLSLSNENMISLVGKGWKPSYNFLDLGDIRQANGLRRKMRLMIRGEGYENFKLHVTSTVPDFVHITVGEFELEGNSSSVPLLIEIPPGAPLCSYLGGKTGKLGEVRLETTSPRAPQWSFKLRFTVIP